MLASQDCQYRCCGEVAQALLGLSAGDQPWIEDCPLCCRPIERELQSDTETCSLPLRREDG